MGESKPPRFCPNCGAQNPMSLPACATCGQPLARRDDHARFWGTEPASAPEDESDDSIIDLYPTSDPSSSATTASDPTVPIEFPGRRVSGHAEAARPVDPWSSSGSRLGAPLGRPAPMTAMVEPVTPAAPAPAAPTRHAGPPGLVLGCLGLLIIVAVAVAFLWSVAESSLENWLGDELSQGISTELASIDAVRVRGSGDVVVTAEQINRELARNDGRFSPLSDLHVELTEEGFVATGTIFRAGSTLTGSLRVTGGRVVVVDPAVTGPASRLIDVDRLAEEFEREITATFRRLDLQPTGIEFADGVVVLRTIGTT